MPAALQSLSSIQPKPSSDASSPKTASSESKTRLKWDVLSTDRLLSWMEIPGNLDRYRSAAILSADGRKRTSALSKVAISKTIVEFMRAKGFNRNDEQIRTKINKFIDTWKKAHLASTSTGFGITDEEAAIGITVVDKLKKLCKEWNRLDPILSVRAGMSAPFVADNEDPVDDTIFADVMPSTSNLVDDEEAVPTSDFMNGTVTAEMLASVEDHRSLNDKKIDGEATDSDEDDSLTNKRKQSAGTNGSSSEKKLRVAVEPKKNTKTMNLVDLFMDTSKEKNERTQVREESAEKRSEKKFLMQERNLEFEMEKHIDNYELQKSEMRLREREMQLREDEASVRKMELQLLLRKE